VYIFFQNFFSSAVPRAEPLVRNAEQILTGCDNEQSGVEKRELCLSPASKVSSEQCRQGVSANARSPPDTRCRDPNGPPVPIDSTCRPSSCPIPGETELQGRLAYKRVVERLSLARFPVVGSAFRRLAADERAESASKASGKFSDVVRSVSRRTLPVGRDATQDNFMVLGVYDNAINPNGSSSALSELSSEIRRIRGTLDGKCRRSSSPNHRQQHQQQQQSLLSQSCIQLSSSSAKGKPSLSDLLEEALTVEKENLSRSRSALHMPPAIPTIIKRDLPSSMTIMTAASASAVRDQQWRHPQQSTANQNRTMAPVVSPTSDPLTFAADGAFIQQSPSSASSSSMPQQGDDVSLDDSLTS
jgi:hypothetical protein